ncbi:MAG: TatD family hydrolase [Patescibacteria group bacterium]
MAGIDTHCHIHFNAYKNDMNEVIKRSLEKGIVMITVGTQIDTSRAAVEVAQNHEGIWATVGLHPHHTYEHTFWDDEEIPEKQNIKSRAEVFSFEVYKALCENQKCVGVGECGLDYSSLPENGKDRESVIELQKQAFRAQLKLADEMNLPIILHSRDAHEDTLENIKEFINEDKLQKRGVAHCFTGTQNEAENFLNLGFMISVTGILTFKARKDDRDKEGLSSLQRLVRDLPIERLMIETDAPYLAPDPYRGKRCEPWMVEYVGQKLAELKKMPVDEVIRITNENARKFFQIEF